MFMLFRYNNLYEQPSVCFMVCLRDCSFLCGLCSGTVAKKNTSRFLRRCSKAIRKSEKKDNPTCYQDELSMLVESFFCQAAHALALGLVCRGDAATCTAGYAAVASAALLVASPRSASARFHFSSSQLRRRSVGLCQEI